MMMEWNDYLKQVLSRIGDVIELSPDTVRGYQMLSNANSKSSLLGEKTLQPIFLAGAVTTRCAGCITFPSVVALKAGSSQEEVSEALGVAVAVAMNPRAALVYSSRVLDAVDAKSGQPGKVRWDWLIVSLRRSHLIVRWEQALRETAAIKKRLPGHPNSHGKEEASAKLCIYNSMKPSYFSVTTASRPTNRSNPWPSSCIFHSKASSVGYHVQSLQL